PPRSLDSVCVSLVLRRVPRPDLHSLPLHDALPILNAQIATGAQAVQIFDSWGGVLTPAAYREFSLRYMRAIVQQLQPAPDGSDVDRKSTRLNSSHVSISYAVFCLNNKNNCGYPLLR